MTHVIEKQQFADPGLYRFPPLLENLELQRCSFDSCQHPAQRHLRDRPLLRNIKLLRCHVTLSELGSLIAEDCLIDTIWFHRGKWGPQEISGCAFKHVTVRGNITGAVCFLPAPLWWRWLQRFPSGSEQRPRSAEEDDEEHFLERMRALELPSGPPPGPANPFARANARFYAGIDWALDISEARFTGVELYRSDIPARLIRRDPETQAVVHREVLLGSAWREILADSSWRFAIHRFLETGFDDTVLVACKRGRYFDEGMAAIRCLRAAGLADPD
jgi:hypothetical protein